MFKKLLYLLLLLTALPQIMYADLDPVDTVWTITSYDGFDDFTISPDGRYVAAFTNGSVGNYHKPAIYDAESGTFTKFLDGWESISYYGACFSPDSRYLAVGGLNSNGLVVWDVDSNVIVRNLVFDVSASTTVYPSFSPTGDTVICSVKNNLVLFDFNTGEVLNSMKLYKAPGKITYSPRGDKILIMPYYGDKYYLVNIDTNLRYKEIKFVKEGEYDEIYSLRFSPDGSKISSCHASGPARIINTDDTSLVKSIFFESVLNICENVIFTNQNDLVLISIASNDTANVLLYDYQNIDVLKTYNIYGRNMNLSNDGQYLFYEAWGDIYKLQLDWTQGMFYRGGGGNEQTVRPNPLNNKGTLSLTGLASEPCEIEIFESGGRHIRKIFAGTPESDRMELEFDTSELPKGAYFCTIKSKSGSKAVKFIVE